MARLICVGLVVAAVAGGAYYVAHFETKIHRAGDGQLRYVTIAPRAGQAEMTPAGPVSAGSLSAASSRPIRIATFNLDPLDENKLANRRVHDVLVRLLPRFDVAAVQGIRANHLGTLLRLVGQLNTAGQRQYRLVTEPHAAGRFSAFLFDQARIEIDPTTVEAVEDLGGRFRHPPLVALFRVRGPDPTEAFTFKLVNIDIETDRAAVELALMGDVYRAVRDDGTGEDDVILLGDFGADTNRPGPFEQILDITSPIAGTPTTLEGDLPEDNVFFDRRATSEFTGRAGVLDLRQEFELTLPVALEVSGHLPVWAEFSPYEG